MIKNEGSRLCRQLQHYHCCWQRNCFDKQPNLVKRKWCKFKLGIFHSVNQFFGKLTLPKRRATTAKQPVSPGYLKEMGFSFHWAIKEVFDAYDIPDDLVININQTPLPFILLSKYTMDKKNKKNVLIKNSADSRQVIWSSITLSGIFLPMQIIPNNTHSTYVRNKKEALDLRSNKNWLLIADVFKGHWVDKVKILIEKHGKIVPVPHNMATISTTRLDSQPIMSIVFAW